MPMSLTNRIRIEGCIERLYKHGRKFYADILRTAPSGEPLSMKLPLTSEEYFRLKPLKEGVVLSNSLRQEDAQEYAILTLNGDLEVKIKEQEAV